MGLLRETVGQAQLDERLARDADPRRFLIDGAQECRGEVHVHALDGATGPDRFVVIEIRRHVLTGIEFRVEFFSGNRSVSRRRSLRIRSGVGGGPR